MEIKSCPFCGSPGSVVHDYDCVGMGDFIDYSFVQCSNNYCCGMGPHVDSYQYENQNERDYTAISLWNARFI